MNTETKHNVVLIGASGFIGSALLSELLGRGHRVKAIVRNPEKVSLVHPDLELVQADVANAEHLSTLCQGADAVLSAYNPGWQNPNIAAETLENYPRILQAVKASGVTRLLIVGGAGSLFCAPNLRVVDAGVIPEEIIGAVRALGDFYLNTLCEERELDWVFFSPAGMIQPGERTCHYRLGKDDLIVDADGNSLISVEDYAHAMVNELEQPKHHQERFTIGY